MRGTFERQMGRSLAGVRVHTGPEAARSADAVGARAFTRGRDIVFAGGEYAPATTRGRELLAHELGHAAEQQRTGQAVLQRQPRPGNPFSVDRARYLRRVQQAVDSMRGRIARSVTLASFIEPILRQLVPRAVFRDEHGVDHGGSTLTHTLSGTPSRNLQLRLVLDDTASPDRHGEFRPTSGSGGTITLSIRRLPTADAIGETLFHEALHMVEWIISTFGAARVGSPRDRRVRALDLSRMGHQVGVVRRYLDRLAGTINPRRRAAGGTPMTPADLDRTARWLLEEVQVRAEAEVFRLARDVERANRSRGPVAIVGTSAALRVDRGIVGHYLFDFSRTFLPGDRTRLTRADREVLADLTRVLQGFFSLQVRRRFSIPAFLRTRGRATFPRYRPPPLRRPAVRSLPLP